jgi:cellulose synthase/poly-beta-1,6-N-acetylglucosamine synthase-like glycosyltransferase
LIVLHSTISLLLTGLYLLVLVYLIKGWAALKRPKTGTGNPVTKVTILIAARNEEARINYTIDDILAQDYPKHLTEIIMVDDHSTDRTAEIIRSYADRGVKLLQLNEDKPLNSYKKKAIARAIGLSTGDLMIATDADCRMGTKWLSSIVNYFETSGSVMISSPVAYFEERSLFEYMQTLEFAYLIGIGAAFIGNGRASTCNGANLAYRKDVFYEVGGFTGIDDLASGDDELLLQKVAVRYPGRIGFLKLREAIVYTHAKHTLNEFLQQRRRWASKSTKYKDKKIVALAVGIWLFNVSLVVNAGLGFYNIYFLKLFALQFLLKYLFEAVFLLPITTFLKRTSLVALLILLIPIHIIYFVYIGFMGNSRKYVWKGRVVR